VSCALTSHTSSLAATAPTLPDAAKCVCMTLNTGLPIPLPTALLKLPSDANSRNCWG
jgi:hypothetical protein